jgi:DNA polymerase III gamma/tau subunit
MEQFIVSARKYRPQTFNDVVGQKAITNTLLNAIESNHLPLPYYLQGLEELEKQLALVF